MTTNKENGSLLTTLIRCETVLCCCLFPLKRFQDELLEVTLAETHNAVDIETKDGLSVTLSMEPTNAVEAFQEVRMIALFTPETYARLID